MKRAYHLSQQWCQRKRERAAVPLPFAGYNDHVSTIKE